MHNSESHLSMLEVEAHHCQKRLLIEMWARGESVIVGPDLPTKRVRPPHIMTTHQRPETIEAAPTSLGPPRLRCAFLACITAVVVLLVVGWGTSLSRCRYQAFIQICSASAPVDAISVMPDLLSASSASSRAGNVLTVALGGAVASPFRRGGMRSRGSHDEGENPDIGPHGPSEGLRVTISKPRDEKGQLRTLEDSISTLRSSSSILYVHTWTKRFKPNLVIEPRQPSFVSVSASSVRKGPPGMGRNPQTHTYA